MDIADFQQRIGATFGEQDAARGIPSTVAWLAEEVGELARLMARSYGDQSFKKSDEGRDLGDEMADILFVLICLANQTGVNLSAAMNKNLEKKTERDKDRHKNNPKLK